LLLQLPFWLSSRRDLLLSLHTPIHTIVLDPQPSSS
jgi:hypothetical protein